MNSRRGFLGALAALPVAGIFGLEVPETSEAVTKRLVLSASWWSGNDCHILYRDGERKHMKVISCDKSVVSIDAKDVPIPYHDLDTNTIIMFGVMNPRLDDYDTTIIFTQVTIKLREINDNDRYGG